MARICIYLFIANYYQIEKQICNILNISVIKLISYCYYILESTVVIQANVQPFAY